MAPHPPIEQLPDSYDPHHPHYSHSDCYAQYSDREHSQPDLSHSYPEKPRSDHHRDPSSNSTITSTATSSATPSRQPSSSPHGTKGSTPKRKQKNKTNVALACVPCKKSHLACDTTRPCRRCCSLNKAGICEDVPVSLGQKFRHHFVQCENALPRGLEDLLE